MTMAEFTAVVDKRVAFRVLLKTAIAIASGSTAIFMLAIGPVLFVNNLASRVDGGMEKTARLEHQLMDLARTVGELQIILATVGTEVKASRSDSAEIKADLKLLVLQQRNAPLPARTANVPSRRTQ